MRAADLTLAVAPLGAALGALALVPATGFDGRAPLPPAVEPYFYGYFLDRYPLFAFALVYALARIVAAAAGPGEAGLSRRLAGGGIGLGLVLAAGLYPTFGGVVVRSGFATGGIAFLQALPWIAAYALGTAAAALTFGAALGLGVLIAGRRPRSGLGLGRRLRAALAAGAARFGALWFAFLVLAAGPLAGTGPWPRRPMTIPESGISAALLLVGLLPHALIVFRRAHTCSRNNLIPPALTR